MSLALNCQRKVVSIAEHEKFSAWSEPANVEIKPWNPPDTDWMRVGLFILGCCVLVAILSVAWEWNV